jgi:choline kinase
MGSLTANSPKCLLPVAGRPLLDWTLDQFKRWGCDPVIAIVGHRAEAIQRSELTKVKNENFESNNVLHSMMCAADLLRGPAIISYSDIWVEPVVYDTLMSTPGDIVLAIDFDWRGYYEGRTKHPLGEAEKAYVDDFGVVKNIGKHLSGDPPPGLRCGEFLGLWRTSADGSKQWRDCFSRVDRQLAPTSPFQQALEWRKAYATDLLQELIDQGVVVRSAAIRRGWAELDTNEDYARLESIAVRQRLDTIVAALGI